jgi:hypothetical protein
MLAGGDVIIGFELKLGVGNGNLTATGIISADELILQSDSTITSLCGTIKVRSGLVVMPGAHVGCGPSTVTTVGNADGIDSCDDMVNPVCECDSFEDPKCYFYSTTCANPDNDSDSYVYNFTSPAWMQPYLASTCLQDETGALITSPGFDASSQMCSSSHPECSRGDCALSSKGAGDPHFLLGDGGLADFKGADDTVYCLLSTSNLTTNVLFVHDVYTWRNKEVHGSWMQAVFVTAVVHTADKPVWVHISFDPHSPNEAQFLVRNSTSGPITFDTPASKSVLTEGHTFAISAFVASLAARRLVISNGQWKIEAKARRLPYAARNPGKMRTDIAFIPTGYINQDPVAPHGLIGQSYDRDNYAIFGALDDYAIPGRVIVTRAMAEGAIEGSASDYEIDRNNPFDVKFKYSRFGSISAPTRDIAKLSGLKVHQEESRGMKLGVAGATNDEV